MHSAAILECTHSLWNPGSGFHRMDACIQPFHTRNTCLHAATCSIIIIIPRILRLVFMIVIIDHMIVMLAKLGCSVEVTEVEVSPFTSLWCQKVKHRELYHSKSHSDMNDYVMLSNGDSLCCTSFQLLIAWPVFPRCATEVSITFHLAVKNNPVVQQCSILHVSCHCNCQYRCLFRSLLS